ncbi:MAG: CRISPR-associated endonuclease Cas2 [Parasporobacterium sp.]|nr:CRISPR-associated endonuclease Cas2 [Parasporobacterium sp.]
MENYFFDTNENETENRVFVLVIYDIIENKRRLKLARYLQGFGFRIQKSAFEALLSKSVYNKMLHGLPDFVTDDDSIRVYKIIGKGQVHSFGKEIEKDINEIIIV